MIPPPVHKFPCLKRLAIPVDLRKLKTTLVTKFPKLQLGFIVIN